MAVVFPGLEDKLSKNIGKSSAFPGFPFKIFNRLFLILQQIVFLVVPECDFVFNWTDQYQEYQNAQDYDVYLLA